jgi:7,8-didemethyl-8-hydroxy-5-deazariboflavin synthase CofH subunit
VITRDAFKLPDLPLDKLLKKINPVVANILIKALDGKDILQQEAIELFETEGIELDALILVSNMLRQKTVGDTVTFIINRNINFTNACIRRCGFCAFSRGVNEPDAYLLSIPQIVKRVREAEQMGATEVCIQGGIHPNLDGNFYFKVCEEIKKAVPTIHIHAFSPEEINFGAERASMHIEEFLKALKDAGLDSIPGTAAEILNDEIRSIICPKKINTARWVHIIKTAHRLHIPTTSTIMYGHVDRPEHWVKHLILLREIQGETGGFTEFVPLNFVYPNTPIYRDGLARPGTVRDEVVKMYAVSRLILNGYINNIQVSWVKLGIKFALSCLNAGANDFGGTLIDENISSAAGATSGQYLSPNLMKKLIISMGRIPAQRTTTYNLIHTPE